MAPAPEKTDHAQLLRRSGWFLIPSAGYGVAFASAVGMYLRLLLIAGRK